MPHPGYGTPEENKAKAASAEAKAARIKANIKAANEARPNKANPMNCACPEKTANLAQISSHGEVEIPPMSVRMA